MPKTIAGGILSVLGSQYYQPIADLVERLLEKEYQKPDRVSAGHRESGYAAAIIILSAAVLESFVQRDRYFYAKRDGSPISELPVAMYLKQVNKYPRHHRLEELFEVRNAVAHNHIWHIEFEVTFPPKTTPLAKKLDCAVMGRKEEAYDPKTPYRGADHRGVEGCPGRGQCPGPVPEARDLGCDVL